MRSMVSSTCHLVHVKNNFSMFFMLRCRCWNDSSALRTNETWVASSQSLLLFFLPPPSSLRSCWSSCCTFFITLPVGWGGLLAYGLRKPKGRGGPSACLEWTSKPHCVFMLSHTQRRGRVNGSCKHSEVKGCCQGGWVREIRRLFDLVLKR